MHRLRLIVATDVSDDFVDRLLPLVENIIPLDDRRWRVITFSYFQT